MDKRSSRDLLSNLPLGIIHAILEKIPIRDAVKTSILSKSWRYNWVTLPNLTFDERSRSPENDPKDFITPLLLLHQGPVVKFELEVPFAEILRNLDYWLIFLSKNCVRILILKSGSVPCTMHSNLYSCHHSLTHLEICHCYLPPPPSTFKGFFSLRFLALHYVIVSSDTIRTLLGDQIILEELTLYDCKTLGGDLDIHAPNLKILHLRASDIKSIRLDAPLLRELSVNLVTDLAPPKSLVCTYAELLGGLSSLEELKGSFNFFKYLSIGLDSSQVSLEFPHLRLIELSPHAFYDKKVKSVVARLSKDALNLHKIRVSCSYFRGSLLERDALPSELECLSDFKFEQLKVIEIGGYSDVSRYMKLIKWLLASSPVLETLIYDSRLLTDSQLIIQTSTLLGFPRASPNAKILLRK